MQRNSKMNVTWMFLFQLFKAIWKEVEWSIKISSQICLSQKYKEDRLTKVSSWVTENHVWEKTVFSDEKRFNLDGPDDWRTYVSEYEDISRQRRQWGSGSIMVWMMTLPNGLFSYEIIKRKFNSKAYIAMLQTTIVPILKSNFGSDFWLQEDNSPVHKSTKVKDFMKSSDIKILSSPAKLNIAIGINTPRKQDPLVFHQV